MEAEVIRASSMAIPAGWRQFAKPSPWSNVIRLDHMGAGSSEISLAPGSHLVVSVVKAATCRAEIKATSDSLYAASESMTDFPGIAPVPATLFRRSSVVFRSSY